MVAPHGSTMRSTQISKHQPHRSIPSPLRENRSVDYFNPNFSSFWQVLCVLELVLFQPFSPTLWWFFYVPQNFLCKSWTQFISHWMISVIESLKASLTVLPSARSFRSFSGNGHCCGVRTLKQPCGDVCSARNWNLWPTAGKTPKPPANGYVSGPSWKRFIHCQPSLRVTPILSSNWRKHHDKVHLNSWLWGTTR